MGLGGFVGVFTMVPPLQQKQVATLPPVSTALALNNWAELEAVAFALPVAVLNVQ